MVELESNMKRNIFCPNYQELKRFLLKEPSINTAAFSWYRSFFVVAKHKLINIIAVCLKRFMMDSFENLRTLMFFLLKNEVKTKQRKKPVFTFLIGNFYFVFCETIFFSSLVASTRK